MSPANSSIPVCDPGTLHSRSTFFSPWGLKEPSVLTLVVILRGPVLLSSSGRGHPRHLRAPTKVRGPDRVRTGTMGVGRKGLRSSDGGSGVEEEGRPWVCVRSPELCRKGRLGQKRGSS